MNKLALSSDSTTSLPLISTRNSTFLTLTTDDTAFALGQVGKINRDKYLREQYNLKLGKKLIQIFI